MNTLFELAEANKPHPAKYTDALLSEFVKMLRGSKRILDPFGGTGKVFLLNHWYPDVEIQAVEIEPEWASLNPRTTLGNALHLPWKDNYFDAICTSPTYGNRMADRDYRDISITKTYSSFIDRPLHPDNGGQMQWGASYRDLHIKAWVEARRVLQVGGIFVLNIKNHIRDGVEQYVTEWHIETLESLGFKVQEHVKVNTPSMRYGQNGQTRIAYESVIKLILEAK